VRRFGQPERDDGADRAGLSVPSTFVADAAKVARSKPAPDIFLACADALASRRPHAWGSRMPRPAWRRIKAAGMMRSGIGDDRTSPRPIWSSRTAQVDLDQCCGSRPPLRRDC